MRIVTIRLTTLAGLAPSGLASISARATPPNMTSGRAEYLYNDVVEIEVGRYASGHMLFVMGEWARAKVMS